MRKIIFTMMLGFVATTSWAGAQTWCVFDPLGTQGDISRRLQDIRLYALQHNTQLKFDTFKNEKDRTHAKTVIEAKTDYHVVIA